MGKYIAKRIGYMALVFLIVSFLMYSLYNLIPTDPARAELEAQTPVSTACFRATSAIPSSIRRT